MPRAYFIAQFDIHDPQTYAAYRAATPLSIEQYGGRFLARGGRLFCPSWLGSSRPSTSSCRRDPGRVAPR